MAKKNIFTVGGTVQAGEGIYIPRKADEELLALCREGTFAYVLTPRQMGKSSLMHRTAERLKEQGIVSVTIDLQPMGTQLNAEQWYLGILANIEDTLMLKTDVLQWWNDNQHLGMTHRLTKFFQTVLLKERKEQIIIFIDEIDTTLSLDFTDDFFIAIRYLYNARAEIPEFKRLSFVLIGVATPADLIADPQRTPFNIGARVDLMDFTLEEARSLIIGFDLPRDKAEQILEWVMKWTGGHPYLTQRLCNVIAAKTGTINSTDDVARLVVSTYFAQTSEQDNNLQFVRDMLTRRAPDKSKVLEAYKQILKSKKPVKDEAQSIIKNHLKLSGIVKRIDQHLSVRNPIYEKAFNNAWIREHTPINWIKLLRRSIIALSILIFILSAPLAWYAWQRKREAEKVTREKIFEKQRADSATKKAIEEKQIADSLREMAEVAKTTALLEKDNAITALRIAQIAEQQRKDAYIKAERERIARERELAVSDSLRRVIANLQIANLQEKSRPKIGLALNGRGALGFAQIGVLKVMEKAGLEFDCISGTGFGSLIGGLYAIGYKADDLEKLALQSDWEDILFTDKVSRSNIGMEQKRWDDRYIIRFPFSLTGGVGWSSGLLAGQKLSIFLSRLTASVNHINDFRQLPISFTSVAVDIGTGDAIPIDGGYLPDAIRAGMADPFVFAPVTLNDRMLIDGSLVRVLPAEDVRKLGAGIVIGVDVSIDEPPARNISSILDVMARISRLQQQSQEDQLRLCDILIRPDMTGSDISTFAFHNQVEIIGRGEAAARRILPQLQALVDSLHIEKSPERGDIKPFTRVDSVYVAELMIKGLKSVPDRYIFSELSISPPCWLRISDLEKKIGIPSVNPSIIFRFEFVP